MQISSNSLGLIRTIIENEGFYPSQSELLRAINSLLPDNKQQTASDNTIQPGETVVVVNHHDSETNNYDNVAEALEYIKSEAVDPWNENEFRREEEDFSIYIVRKELTVNFKINPSVSFND